MHIWMPIHWAWPNSRGFRGRWQLWRGISSPRKSSPRSSALRLVARARRTPSWHRLSTSCTSTSIIRMSFRHRGICVHTGIAFSPSSRRFGRHEENGGHPFANLRHCLAMPFYSPLRYPGGKRRLAPVLRRLLDENGLKNIDYVEPYAGGAGVALAL